MLEQEHSQLLWNSSFLTDTAVSPPFWAHSHLPFAALAKNHNFKKSLIISRAGKTPLRTCSSHGIPENSLSPWKQQKSVIFIPE